MSHRIDKKFQELKKLKKKAFIPFVTVGFPSLAATSALVLELANSGADLIELGVPFSDPVADGPTIQQASQKALAQGATLAKTLKMVATLRKKTNVPLVAMTYYNPILHYGSLRFVRDALKAGLDGVIVPDLPPEEESVFLVEAAEKGLHSILFISPATSKKRIAFIAQRAKGFIYFVSVTGVTGARTSLPKDLKSQLNAIKKAAPNVPICAGFGISIPKQVRQVAALCDGVIVGSALIKEIETAQLHCDFIKRVGRFARRLKGDI